MWLTHVETWAMFEKTIQNRGVNLILDMSLNVPIFHITQPLGIWSTRWLLFLVMSNIPKMGQLPTPIV